VCSSTTSKVDRLEVTRGVECTQTAHASQAASRSTTAAPTTMNTLGQTDPWAAYRWAMRGSC